MKELLKKGREAKNIKTREVASLLKIDQALISKFENGLRMPTKTQMFQLAELLEIDRDTLHIAWLKQKILHEIGDDKLALPALNETITELGGSSTTENAAIPASFDKLLAEMESLKTILSQKK